MSRVGHAKFDLVIMNPPFTRPTNHEPSMQMCPYQPMLRLRRHPKSSPQWRLE